MQKLVCPRGGVSGLTFSPDGDLLAGIGQGVLYCWTRSRGWEQSGLRHPYHSIAEAAFHPAGHSLIYGLAPSPRPNQRGGGDDEFAGFAGVRLYSLTAENVFDPDRLLVTTSSSIATFPHNWLAGVAFTRDGRTLVANQIEDRGFFTRSIPIILHWYLTQSGNQWKVSDANPIRTEAENGAALIGSDYLVLAGMWGVRLCPLDSSAVAPLYAPVVGKAQAVATALCGELVATVEGAQLSVWNLRTEQPISVWPVPSMPHYALEFAPDGRTLAVGDSERTVAFYNPFHGRTAEYDFDVGPVFSLAYAPDGLTLAVAGRNGLVVIDVD